jgi:hypothetical protein
VRTGAYPITLRKSLKKRLRDMNPVTRVRDRDALQ